MQDLLNFIRFLPASSHNHRVHSHSFQPSHHLRLHSVQAGRLFMEICKFWTRYGLLGITTSYHLPTRCRSESSELDCLVDFPSTSLSAHPAFISFPETFLETVNCLTNIKGKQIHSAILIYQASNLVLEGHHVDYAISPLYIHANYSESPCVEVIFRIFLLSTCQSLM